MRRESHDMRGPNFFKARTLRGSDKWQSRAEADISLSTHCHSDSGLSKERNKLILNPFEREHGMSFVERISNSSVSVRQAVDIH